MPGKGKLVQRDYDAAERAAIGHLIALLGPTTYDVFLNDKVYWSNVPSAVWEYTLGGYQVIKKWLSYREKGPKEKPVLGRSITKDEARYVRDGPAHRGAAFYGSSSRRQLRGGQARPSPLAAELQVNRGRYG
jgi:hypothetical protein